MLDAKTDQFPSDFKFGTSTLAHQIEGKGGLVELEDGKGISMWDEFSHAHPKNILDRTTADIACDSYHKFEEDVFILKSIHANSYNFTLSWSRILPDGTTRFINKKGLDYYDDLINTLLENGIEPIVTLSDMDLPLPLVQKYAGGWLNKKLIYAFESYAKLCFAKFGDRVQQWITMSQPWTHSWNSYSIGVHPPNLSLGSKGAYIAFTNLLTAHSSVYRLHEKRFKQKQGGKVGISFSCSSTEVGDLSEQLDRIMCPLAHGKYSRYLTETPKIDKECGQLLTQDGWTSALKDCFDFVALHFTPEINVNPESCKLTLQSSLEFVQKEPSSEFTMQNVLKAMKTEYGNPEVFVFCVGPRLASPSQMMDIDRAQYFSEVAKNILEATTHDNCNVKGYFPGKLMDCWEWDSGFTKSYGLFHVDFTSRKKKRSPRASVVFVLKHLFKEKRLQPDLF